MGAGTSPTEEAGTPGFGEQRTFHEDAKEAAGTVRRDAAEVFGTLKGQARQLLDEQKAMAADRIHGMAEALRRASEELSASRNDSMADAVRRTADNVEGMAGCVRSESVSDLYRYAEDFSRRHPAVVVGGAAAAAFLFARFVRASGDSHQSRARDDRPEFEEGIDEAGGPY